MAAEPIMNTKDYPNPYIFADGSKVDSPEKWSKRAEELKNQYIKEMYGYPRSGEKVSYRIENEGAEIFTFFRKEAVPDAKKLTIGLTIERDGATVSTEFSAAVFLPDKGKVKMPEGGWPFIVCMHMIGPKQYAVEHGYAMVVLNTLAIASDNTEHKGCFYDLYPYGTEPEQQTGVLAAWGWSCSKVLDAMYAGAAAEMDINPDNSIVTGVSRWGKATAVCGMLDSRFKLVMPSCSGAGGLALYRYFSQGHTFDFSSKGAPASYIYDRNEPIESLTSPAERGWFNDTFLKYTEPEQIPLEQYELPAICADKNRYYFIIGSCISEDWVNAPSMWLCYKAAKKIYNYLGLGDHIICNIHKEGHAVIDEDMKYMIEYFNKMVYGIEPEDDLSVLNTSVFDEKVNYDPLFDEIGENW